MDGYDLFKKLSFGAKFSPGRNQKFYPDKIKKENTFKKITEHNLTEKNLLKKNNREAAFLFNSKDNLSDNSSFSYNVSQNDNDNYCDKQDYDSIITNNLRLLGDITVEISESITLNGETQKKRKRDKSEEKLKILRKEKMNEIRNHHHISAVGKKVAEPIENFEELSTRYNVSEVILNNLKKSGYVQPTPIQMQAIPLMLEEKQVLACAPTGSGKTAAFLVPVIHHLKGPRKLGFRAVIVCPTRELAAQTYREALRLGDGTGLKVHIVSKISHAREKFGVQSSQKFDMLITTPNRLVYLLKQDPPIVSLKNVEWLIVDESDKLFEEGVRGFRDQLASIYHACESPDVKRAMFSATQTPHLTKWCRRNLKNLISVTIGVRNTASEIVNQELLFVGSEAGKLIAFRDLIRKGVTPPVLVFVQTKERAQELFTELIYDGINVDVIHSDRTQLQRDNVVRSFREGKIWVLICTELMGRGMDFKGVNLVVNYDFPPSAVSYIHRIGRTGRAGRPGTAITYFTQDDTVNLRSIAQVLRDSGCEVADYMLKLKRTNKADRKRLEKKAPRRESISTKPHYQEVYDKKKENAIKRSKRLKKKKKSDEDSIKKE